MTTYTAGRALFVRGDNGPKLIMIDGMGQVLDRATNRLSVTRFADFTYDLGGLLTGRKAAGRSMDEVFTPELLTASPDLQTETKATRHRPDI